MQLAAEEDAELTPSQASLASQNPKGPKQSYHSICNEQEGNNEDQSRDDGSNESLIGHQILALGIPALGALLIDPILNLTDTALVGRFGGEQSVEKIAGMGAATALLSFALTIFNFFCIATTPLVGSARAAQKMDVVQKVGGQALTLSLILGVLMSMALLVFHRPLLHLYGTHAVAGTGTEKYAEDFLLVRALAAPAVLCISASTGILRGCLDTVTPVGILLLANLLNLALDFALIPTYGPKGAAIATTTAEWISAMLFLGILAGKLPARQELKGITIIPLVSVPAWNDVKPLLVASSSVFQRSLFLQFSLSFAASMAARSGIPSVLAAHQIAMQLWFLCSCISDGLEAAAQALVADAVGKGSRRLIRTVSTTIFSYALLLGILLGIGLAIGFITRLWLTLFTSDPNTQHRLSRILWILVWAQPMNSVVFAADGVLQGASQFAYQATAMGISAASSLLFYFCWTYTVITQYPLVHIWSAIIVLQVVRGLTSLYKLVEKDGPFNLLMQS